MATHQGFAVCYNSLNNNRLDLITNFLLKNQFSIII